MSFNSKQQIQVLHVDDEPEFADLTGTFLEREDDRFTVETATSADDGLEIITDRPPDCVVSDYNMPGMDGLEFLQAVREDNPDLPFILFTGKGSEEVASDAISTGATDYLQKRSGTDQYSLLANRILNAVRQNRSEQRLSETRKEYTTVFENAQNALLLVDVEDDGFRYQQCNPRATELIGRDRTEIVGKSPREALGPENGRNVVGAYRKCIHQRESVGYTVTLDLPVGQVVRDCEVTPVTSDGEIEKLVVEFRDVTDQRERKRALEKVETLFEHAQDSLFLIDVTDEFVIERVNPAYEDATGVAASEIQGQTPKQLLGEEQGTAIEARYRECVERRQPLQYTEQLQFGADPTYWETRIAPVVVDGTVEYIVGSTRDVTDQKERQRDLRVRQQAIDNANVSITLDDLTQEDTSLVYVNDAFEELTGYPPEESLGRNCRFLQGEETDPEKVATLRQAIDAEEPVTVELRNYRKDGTEFWNRVSLSPIYDDDGQLIRYLGIQEDITERKERQRELTAERRFIMQALDTLDDLFYVFDVDGSLQRWNERVPDVTGYTEAELDGKQAIEMFPEDDSETMADAFQMAVTGETVTVEANLLTTDGQRIPYEFTAARLTDESGDTTGIVGIGRDLTERKQRDRRFQALVEESNDIISVVDAEGVYQYQSPSLERILGHDPEETIGETVWEYIHPEDRERVSDEFQAWVTNPDRTVEDIQYRARHADGSWHWMEANGSDQLTNPAVEGYVITSRDITDRKERQQELERTQELMVNMEELADAGAWEYDPETEQLMITDGTRRLYGLDPDAGLTLEAALDAVHPEDRDLLADRFNNCLETGEPYHLEVRLTTVDGAQRWLTAHGERISESEAGSVVRGYIRDITGEKTRERRLTELNQVTQAFITAENRQEVLDIGVEAASDVLDLQATAIHLSEAGDTRLVPAAQTDDVASLIGDAPPLPVADSIAGRIYRDGEPAMITDVQQDPDVHDSDTDLGGHLYLPLGDHGILIAGSENRGAFDQQDLALGELLARTLATALDRIEREQTARQRQQQLSLFFEESPLGAVQWDDQLRFERLNEQAEAILGYSEEELRQEPWNVVIADEDRDHIRDTVESLLDADGGEYELNRNVRKDGEVITCEWYNRVVTDADGDVQSVFSKFQDVTDRERRKTELEEYETIIEALSDAVYVLDEEGQFTYVNDEFVELVGYNRETILGNTPSLIKDEEAVQRAEQELGRLLSSDGPKAVMFEVTINPREGDPIVCEDHIGVLPYEGDQFNGSVGTLRDITDQKERERELEAVKSQYQTLIESYPDGSIFLYDTDLRVVRAGGSELSEVGLSLEEIEGTTPQDRYPPEIAEELVSNIENALGGESHTFEQEYQGEHYRVQIVPVRMGEKEITHAMAVSQNITDQIENRRELKHQNERLDEFASIVSHDLRSPLTVAEGHLELAQETRESEDIARAADAIDRSQALIDDLLTLAREGEQVTEVESVALADVAENSWQTTETRSATLETDTTQAVRADRSRLQQLFENLYRNAVEHGGEDVTVSVGAMDDGFYVADTGPGIPESEREDIFEAGYSTNEDGTGFGLRIVEQIADAHGWEIAVGESEQGGARFEVTGVEFADH